MSTITIKKVESTKDLMTFIKFPWKFIRTTLTGFHP